MAVKTQTQQAPQQEIIAPEDVQTIVPAHIDEARIGERAIVRRDEADLAAMDPEMRALVQRGVEVHGGIDPAEVEKILRPIEVTPQQARMLRDGIPMHEWDVMPDGTVYIPGLFIRQWLAEVFGFGKFVVQAVSCIKYFPLPSKPGKKQSYRVVQKFVFAVAQGDKMVAHLMVAAEMKTTPENFNAFDPSEGLETSALYRIAKHLGVPPIDKRKAEKFLRLYCKQVRNDRGYTEWRKARDYPAEPARFLEYIGKVLEREPTGDELRSWAHATLASILEDKAQAVISLLTAKYEGAWPYALWALNGRVHTPTPQFIDAINNLAGLAEIAQLAK